MTVPICSHILYLIEIYQVGIYPVHQTSGICWTDVLSTRGWIAGRKGIIGTDGVPGSPLYIL